MIDKFRGTAKDAQLSLGKALMDMSTQRTSQVHRPRYEGNSRQLGIQGENYCAGDLTSCRQKPVILDCPNKLVYTPHVWGPSICNQAYFLAKNFPNNMPDIWGAEWGHICSTKPLLGPACVLGENRAPMSEVDSNCTFLLSLRNYISCTFISLMREVVPTRRL